MRIAVYYFYLIFAITIYSCANVVTPTGGQKDITPPTVLQYTPDSNTLYFDATEIQIQFDEYVVLNDVFNQVIISPPLDGIPEYRIKGKTLTIKLNSTLRDSTTYTINFGQAIKDNTEGNILNNFTYVFSTGSYLDSLQISGKVTDLLTGIPSEKTFVVLYYEPTDTSFTTSKPYYFTKTDETGNFKISNIKAGNYKLYALEDQNFNYYYDLPNERIAFQRETIFIDSNISGQKLQIFSEEKIKQNLLETKSQRYAQTQMVFSKPTNDVIINSLNPISENIYFTKNKTKDTIIIWSDNFKLDTFRLKINYDTSEIIKKIYLKSIPVDSNFQLNKNTFTSNVIAINKGEDARADWDPEKVIILKFYNPVLTFDTTMLKIWSVNDSIFMPHPIIKIDSLDSRKVYIQYSWKPENAYDIILAKNFTKDIFGLENKPDTLKILLKKQDAYSLLTTTIKNLSGQNIIFQLMKSDLSPVEEIYIDEAQFTSEEKKYAVTINYLVPGIYRIRAIIDLDKNGKWSPGDLSKNTLPEPVILFPIDQNLRANWENEIDWVIK